MKDFVLWLVGSIILSPIVIFILSGSFLGFLCAVVYCVGIYGSLKIVPRFWKKWFAINADYALYLEHRK